VLQLFLGQTNLVSHTHVALVSYQSQIIENHRDLVEVGLKKHEKSGVRVWGLGSGDLETIETWSKFRFGTILANKGFETNNHKLQGWGLSIGDK